MKKINVNNLKVDQQILEFINEEAIPLGQGNLIKSGEDVTIVAFSIMVGKALSASKVLSDQNINSEIIDLRTVKPLDINLILESVKKTNKLIICEEGFPFSGISSEIISQVQEKAFDWLDAPISRVTGLDVPLPYAENLEKMALPQVEDIVEAALSICNRSGK